MNNYEGPIKDRSGQYVAQPDSPHDRRNIPKIFVLCDWSDTAPVWGYMLRQQGLTVILENNVGKALDHGSSENPDLVVIDIDARKHDPVVLYRDFRAVSVAPILLLLPSYNETQILEAYAAGVDDVIVKPVSPPVFLAKILSWGRRSWTVPVNGLGLVMAGKHKLDPTHRCLITPDGMEVRLTNLEFRLLHLLMSRPSYVFSVEDIIEAIWGGYGEGDQVLLKNVVYRLRKKIEADPGRPILLKTWQGGYSFQG